MLRKLKSAFPVFLLALLAQIFAPTAARLAMAEASNSFDILPICSPSNSPDHQQGHTGGHHHPGKCCDFCQIANGTPSPLVVDSFAVFVPWNLVQHIDWDFPTDLVRADAYESHAQARAPPSPS